ncbi:protein toll-like [Dendronephthya gigantea]|uniref:protein toll-like n=1 Tax=Dendronephthya gigantea TaxID=151771 RepID=UPI00106AD750|nr:protein toll-like [Dendronephthya gigantea]
MLFIALIWLLNFHVVADGCPNNLETEYTNICNVKYKFDKKQFPLLFTVGEREFLNSQPVGLILSSRNATMECTLSLNVEDILRRMAQTSVVSERHVAFLVAFHCPNPARVSFCRAGNVTENDIIMHLGFTGNCRVTGADLAVWGRTVNVHGLHLHNQVTLQDNGETKAELQGLFNIGLLTLSNMKNKTIPRMFLSYVWEKMAELQLRDMLLLGSEIDILKTTMPYLQSLVLCGNNLRALPNFPWCKTGLKLPRNLSRTSVLDAHYTEDAIVNPRLYRRFFAVHSNPGINHKNYKFSPGNLDKISLRANELKFINSTMFDDVTGLKVVDLSRNNLSHIPERIFEKTLDIVSINFDNNSLTSLNGKIFKQLTNLQTLSVKNNFIYALRNGFLTNTLQKLETINFENNLLSLVEPNAVPQGVFDALRKINFRKNKLREVPQFGFYVRNLESFDVSENKVNFAGFVKTIDSVSFQNIVFVHTNLGSSIHTKSVNELPLNSNSKKILNLQGNAIERFDLHDFNSTRLKKLMFILRVFTIRLTENPLHCDCRTRELQLKVRNWTKTVKEITGKDFDTWICQSPVNLRGKKVLNVPPSDLRCVKRDCPKCPERCSCYHDSNSDFVTFVDCRGRNLTAVPKDLPKETLELCLQDNQIEELTLSKSLENVTVIKAGHNKIKSVHLVDTPLKLKEIYLNSNKLTKLPKRFQNLSLSKIDINNNYFTCDCKSLWMKNWLKKQEKIFAGGARSVVCSSGGMNVAKPLISIEDKDFVCSKETDPGKNANRNIHTVRDVVFYAVAGIFFLNIIAAILLYRFRKELKLILYTRFNWHPFDRVDDSDPSKIYDAFVSFNIRDKVWVEKTLQEKLEKDHNPPYKLCVHYRDFIPGAPIAETILDCVKKSRRMIMVLSRNFIQSEWCMLEFRAAHRRVLKGRVNYLIVVLFDDVDVDSLDDELKLYLKTNTYLSVESKWFWQQLKYALPQKKLETGDEGLPNEGIQFEERHLGMV